MKRVCVFAGSSQGLDARYREAAEDLGRALARRDVGLVYGGARIGLMGALANAVLAQGGEVVGVIPEALVSKEIAHAGISDLRIVKTMHERKATMAELSDAFVALPGGWGTLEELFEVLTWAQLGLHRKPCGVLNVNGYFEPLLALLEHSIAEGFVRPEHRAIVAVSVAPEPLLDRLAAYEPPVVEKWIDAASV